LEKKKKIALVMSSATYIIIILVLMVFPIYLSPSTWNYFILNSIPLIMGLLVHIIAHRISGPKIDLILTLYDIIVISFLVLIFPNLLQDWKNDPIERVRNAEFWIFIYGRDILFSGLYALVFLLSTPLMGSVFGWLYDKSQITQNFLALLIGTESKEIESKNFLFLKPRWFRYIILTGILVVILWIIIIISGIPTYTPIGQTGESSFWMSDLIITAPFIVGNILLLELLDKKRGKVVSHFYFKLVFTSISSLGIFIGFITRLQLIRFITLPIVLALLSGLIIAYMEREIINFLKKLTIGQKIIWFIIAAVMIFDGEFYRVLPYESWRNYILVISITNSTIGASLLSFFLYRIGRHRTSRIKECLFILISCLMVGVTLSVRFTSLVSLESSFVDITTVLLWLDGFIIIIVGTVIFPIFPYVYPILVGYGLILTRVLWPPWFVLFPLLIIVIGNKNKQILINEKYETT